MESAMATAVGSARMIILSAAADASRRATIQLHTSLHSIDIHRAKLYGNVKIYGVELGKFVWFTVS